MKLSTALAVLIAIQRHGHRMMCVLASADDHERKLRINQDEAAKRVNDAVELARASIYAGDVHGVALPLNFVVLGDGEQQLTVALRLPGVDMDQHLFVDTGSSSLAFCNQSLVEEAVNITKMDYAQCIPYGEDFTCPDDPSSKGGKQYYVGQVFQGNIAAYNNDTGDEIASMDDVYFVIMSKVQDSICQKPLNGIIGVAFSNLNKAVEIPSPDFDVVSLWNPVCETNNPLYPSLGNCITGNMSKIPLPSPLQQSLQGGVDSGYNSVEAFGLYCDYAATIGSEKDTIVHSLGAYFGGDVALNNIFYNSGTPQVARGFLCGLEKVYYMLSLRKIQVPALNFSTKSDFNQCNDHCNPNCFTDSGQSWIDLPLPTSYCNDLMNTNISALKEMGSLLLDLEGVNGSTITLSLPLLWLVEQMAKWGNQQGISYPWGNVRCTGATGEFVLGFPIYQYYYLVYDMGNNTITFVDLPQSNETEAFIYGPEYGGVVEPSTNNEPSNGYRHTGGLGTNTFVVAGLFMLACKYIF